MTNTHPTPVSVLGLGGMGTELARALIAKGHPVTVWNRTSARTDQLVELGAARASDPAEAISASPVVIACLLDHQSVRDTFDDHTEHLRGKTLVNLTTTVPGQARELAAWAACHAFDVLDGGIMAVPPMIGGPDAFLLYSGPREAFDRVEPVLAAFGEARYLDADPGRAALYDIALLTGMYGAVAGIIQALALVRAEGQPSAEVAPLLSRWLRGVAAAVGVYAEQIDSRDYAKGTVANLAMQTTGFGHLLDFAESQGVSAELLAPLAELMRRRVAEGHGHEEVTGIVEFLLSKGSTS
ncbi:6-phosphogluconate dehydrogenase [Prauserella marina]|uniref:3-hydroxyisobutyrate dehydrogenase n=1 Tax=Prauserella marina TaxID=530584 RepID=A0A222VQN5_9PSEU|nr:NAD(P)-binding domain-containing protein [Prauserella marina]ASR36225.1 6-phosphogluconate dehydrogenase [Prauserella marina]PWV76984.1 3-hydroxyisobutyrate dehydrogenase-like beta-hydroxyacid dehydrogenase [Prauserella marina]SDD01710.1 3-hydroxyisobutyrate dehydrogenase [Prauserella marina]